MVANSVVISVLAFLMWITAMIYFWRYQVQRIALLKELNLLTTSKRKREKFSTLVKRYVFRLADKFSTVGQRFRLFVNEQDLERKIALAGHPEGLNVPIFYGLRFVLLFVAFLLSNLASLFGTGPIFLVLLVGAALAGPQLWINSASKKRQEQIGTDLPDFLDAMSVTLQAGTPLDPALKHVVGNLEGPLSEEMTRFIQELDLGVPRDEAYSRLTKRNNCKELETLIVALIQGSKLGVPIAQTFRIMAEDMRATKIGKIKEKAAKIGPKVTLVTSLLILPGVIISVMGLLVLHLVFDSGLLEFF